MIAYAKRLLALKPGVCEILFSISLLAVLKPLFTRLGCPPNFFISIYGRPNSMKSTLAELFFVHTSGQNCNFISSSKKEIEQALNLFQGHTIVIDDYHLVSSSYDKQKLSSRMDLIARSVDNPNHALAVITGEFLDGSFSVQDRMIQISIDTPVDNLLELSYLQRKTSILSALLFEFAKIVYEQQEEISSFITTQFKMLSNTPHSPSAPIYRIERNIHFLILSMEIFNKYFLKGTSYENIGNNQEMSPFNQLKELQITRMNRLLLFEGDIDWLIVLYDMLLLKDGFWEVYHNFPDKTISSLHMIVKEDIIFIRSPILKRALRQYLGKPVDLASLCKALIEEDMLKEDQSSNTHMMKRNKDYYYAIKYLKLKLYYLQAKDN